MKLHSLIRIDRSARRLAEILAVLTKYGLADWISNLDYEWLRGLFKSHDGEIIPDLTMAERIRCALTDLGTGFVKLGQILSTRPDLVSPEVIAELSKLQTQTPADSFETVAGIIEADLGKPVESLFRSFENRAMASASIGQVHEATLKDGRPVVVKVLHRGIEEKVQCDLDLLLGLAELAEKHAPQLRRYQPVASARYFQRTILRELDFAYERRHLERFGGNFADDETVRFPKVHSDLSASRVLTMEKIEGIPFTDPEALRQTGADLREFARRGANVYLEMIFRDGFYHADPHPGNLFLLPGGTVGIIDCGMVGYLDDTLRDDIEGMLLAAKEGDANGFTDAVIRVGHVPPELDEDELRAEVGEFLGDYVGQSLVDFDFSGALQRMFTSFRDFRIVLPPSFGMLMKTLVVLEGTSRRLTPDFSLATLLGPYYARALRRRMAPRRMMSEIRRSLRDWRRLLDSLPRDLGDILTRFRKGTLEVHMEHRRLESTVDRLVMGLLTAAVFLGSAMMWSMGAPPTVFGVSLFGALGFVVSVWMGSGLIWSLRKARKRRTLE